MPQKLTSLCWRWSMPCRIYKPRLALCRSRTLPLHTQAWHKDLKELKIHLPDKFDGHHGKFCDFLNHCRLLFLLCLRIYPMDWSRVGLIISLLTREVQVWASPLWEKYSPFLGQFKNSVHVMEIILMTQIEHSWHKLCSRP